MTDSPQFPATPPSTNSSPTPDTPPASETRPDPFDPHPNRWNKRKMADFLRMLAATQNVSAAAKSVGMSRQSAYKLRARLKGAPFDLAWETAFRHGYDNLAHAALERALNGVEVPHYYHGELVGTSRRYDERLTVALLAMRNRSGAPLLGRYGAAAEYYGERWDALLERVHLGPADWERDGETDNSDREKEEEDVLDFLKTKYAPENPGRR